MSETVREDLRLVLVCVCVYVCVCVVCVCVCVCMFVCMRGVLVLHTNNTNGLGASLPLTCVLLKQGVHLLNDAA